MNYGSRITLRVRLSPCGDKICLRRETVALEERYQTHNELWVIKAIVLYVSVTMPNNYLRLYLHVVWATYDRLPLIESEWEAALYHEIHNEANNVEAKVLALGGIEDHVHLLIRFDATHSVAEIVKQIKGGSAFFVNEQGLTRNHFKWQGGYAALTVSQWNLDTISKYILNQKQHHAANTTIAKFELEDKLIIGQPGNLVSPQGDSRTQSVIQDP